MSHTTTRTPARKVSVFKDPAVIAGIAAAAVALSIVAYLDVRQSTNPAVAVSTSCDSNGDGGTANVDLRHFPPSRADIVMYTAGDVWANGFNPRITDGSGGYTVSGAPAGQVTVEITPEGRAVITKHADVPKCGRS